MSFPADIKGCMKDCILSLFWPRKDIVGFFEKHGCSRAEIAAVQIEGENACRCDAPGSRSCSSVRSPLMRAPRLR